MSTGKTIALTRQTFVGKVMSLLFNMLSRLVITFLPRSKNRVNKTGVKGLFNVWKTHVSGIKSEIVLKSVESTGDIPRGERVWMNWEIGTDIYIHA